MRCNTDLGRYENRKKAGVINSDAIFDLYIARYLIEGAEGFCQRYEDWQRVMQRIHSITWKSRPENLDRYLEKMRDGANRRRLDPAARAKHCAASKRWYLRKKAALAAVAIV